jgi:hypothetical protein
MQQSQARVMPVRTFCSNFIAHAAAAFMYIINYALNALQSVIYCNQEQQIAPESVFAAMLWTNNGPTSLVPHQVPYITLFYIPTGIWNKISYARTRIIFHVLPRVD